MRNSSHNTIDLSNKRFGKLVVLERAENNKRRNTQWLCKCDCGVVSVKRGQYLRDGRTRSCGCQKFKGDNPYTESGSNHPNWKTGKYKDAEGYVRVWIDVDTYEREHRLVMQQHLGRKLLESETVHHKNGKRDDNRLENLELRCSDHGEGQRIEDMIEFWTEKLRFYAPERLAEGAL